MAGFWLSMLMAIRGKGGVERIQTETEASLAAIPRTGDWWSTGALTVRGIARLVAGRYDDADEILETAVESFVATEAWNGASLGLAERAVLAMDREDWTAAEILAKEAESIVKTARMAAYPPNALVFAVQARLAIRRRDSETAVEMLTQAQRLRPRLTSVITLLSIQVRLVLAQAYAALPDPAGARTQLREARGLMSRGDGFGTLETQAAEISLQLETSQARTPGASTLTTAELRLLPLLPTQLTFREIGERLFLSRHTVKSQAMSIYRKLDVTSRTAAVECARDLGLI